MGRVRQVISFVKPVGRRRGTDVTILTVAHDVADARLHRMYRALAATGLTVDVIGVGDPSTSPCPGRTRCFDRASGVRRVGRSVFAPFRSRAAVLVVIDPDPVFSSLLARALGIVDVVVCDVHEDYRLLARDRNWPSWFSAVAARLAGLMSALAARADITIVADEHVPPHQARRRRVVRNVPTIAPIIAQERRDRSMVYVGDVRESRGLTAMLDLVDEADGWTLDIVGPVNVAADRDLIESRSSSNERIRWWGRKTPSEAREIMARSQVGLCLLKDTPAFTDSMPSKIYDYLNAGLAIVTSSLRRPAAFVVEARVGVVADSTADIARQLRSWHDDPSSLRVVRERSERSSREHLGQVDEFTPVAAEIAALRASLRIV